MQKFKKRTRARTPRKLKKKLKKTGVYQHGTNFNLCIACQKHQSGFGFGFDMYFCHSCWEKGI